MSLSLIQLQCLAAFEKHGSVTAAASALGLSQPAVTRALQEIQIALGCTLFARKGRQLELTEVGQLVLEHAESVVTQEEEACEDLSRWLKSRHPEVRLAASAASIATMLPAAIALVRRTHPEARILVVEAIYPNVMHLFREQAIDLCIGPMPDDILGGDFYTQEICAMPFLVALPARHRLRACRSLHDLRHISWVACGSLETSVKLLQTAFTQSGLDVPKPVLHCDSVVAALQFIEQSDDLAGLIPYPLAIEAGHADRVSLPPIQDTLPTCPIGIFYPSRISQTIASRALFGALHLAAKRFCLDYSNVLGPNCATNRG